MAVASTAIAATDPRRPHAARRATALLVAASVLVACSSSIDDDGEAQGAERPTTTSTTTAAVRCPDGSMVPDTAPVAEPPAASPRPRGPDGRAGGLDIGTLLPLTGELAFLGAAAFAGVELAVEDLDAAGGVLGLPIGLRHADSAEGSPGTAETGLGGLLDSGVDVVIGPLSSATAANVLDQVAARDALLVSPAATSSGLDALDGTGRLFRTGPTEAVQGRALADLLVSDGHRTVSVAARGDEYGQAIADAVTARLGEVDGAVVARADYDPSAPELGDDVVDRLDLSADAIVLVGLAESALVLDALVAAGEAPRERAVYGTDGNLGERLRDLVEDPGALACFRGLLPVDEPASDFAERVRSHASDLAGLDEAGLDLAAESYDATVVAALAAAAARSDAAEAMAREMAGVTVGATPCADPQACLELLASGTDVSYVGQTGRLVFDVEGNRTDAGMTMVAFDADGHLARLGGRRVRS